MQICPGSLSFSFLLSSSSRIREFPLLYPLELFHKVVIDIDILSTIFTLSLSILILNSQCKEDVSDVSIHII